MYVFWLFLLVVVPSKGATTFSKLRVQFLSLGYYYPVPFYRKQLDRSIRFGAFGYIITLFSSKSYVKSRGVRPNFGEVRIPRPPVVAPMVPSALSISRLGIII